MPGQDTERVMRCRDLLADCTPLNSDCGALCGAACCRSLEGEETGMLLFPGEEILYRDRQGFRMAKTGQGTLLICSGMCDRRERPLACRLFPLLPVIRDGGIRVAVDARARTVCPLRRVDACGAGFIKGVRRVGEILAEDPVQRAFLERLTGMHDELRALQRQMNR